VSDERRHFQRLTLSKPVDGWFGDYSVRLLNISATGALLQSDEPIAANARALLRFFWRGKEVEILAETLRPGEGKSGVKFVEESEVLLALIADSAKELLRAQEANAMGIRDQNLIGDETLTASSAGARIAGFVTWSLTANGWKKRHSLLPDQPEDGFTVSIAEDDQQIALLRNTYENGDDEARRLTRLLAEISVAAAH
jgi:hypothetical protein